MGMEAICLRISTNLRACCHISLPDGSVASFHEFPSVFRVSQEGWGGRWVAVAWDGTRSPDGHVGVPLEMAQCMQLRMDEPLYLEPVPYAPRADFVMLQPETESDVAVLLSSTSATCPSTLETTLLAQVAVVAQGMTLPLRSGPRLLNLRVTRTLPSNTPVRLFLGLNLHVVPAPLLAAPASSLITTQPTIASALPSPSRVARPPTHVSLAPSPTPTEVTLLPAPSGVVWTPRGAWPSAARVSGAVGRNAVVTVACAGVEVAEGHVGVAPELRGYLHVGLCDAVVMGVTRFGTRDGGCDTPVRVVLEPEVVCRDGDGMEQVVGLVSEAVDREIERLVEAWVGLHVGICGMALLAPGAVLSFLTPWADSAAVHLRVRRVEGCKGGLTVHATGELAEVSYECAKCVTVIQVPDESVWVDSPHGASESVPPWCQDAATQALDALLSRLWAPRVFSGLSLAGRCPVGILLAGKQHCGKTALAKGLCRSLASMSPPVWTTLVACLDLLGLDDAGLEKRLRSILQQAAVRAPAVVFLDDLDALLPASEGDEETAHMRTTAVVSGLLREILQSTGGSVQVVACVRDSTSLAEDMCTADMLSVVVAVPSPGPEDRASVLSFHLADIGAVPASPPATWAAVCVLEGFDASDLRTLVDRAVLVASARGGHSVTGSGHETAVSVTQSDVEGALRGMVPGSQLGTKSVDGPGAGLESVGGMREAKQVLREALELPLRLTSVVSRAPIRVRAGVLLYGPPGCGKTHLARAAVASAGLRLIAVKGAELLNKYIGASEAAVRAVFERAAAAAPCVVFFDEIEAAVAAPRRGSDSTGVTDRVVNQLLTELDGVESLQGVAVLAASSRPDLVDPALLRPGRLDRMVMCQLPDEKERLDILTVLSRNVRMGQGVDLGAVAKATAGYCGADLQGVLTGAEIRAVRGSQCVSDTDTPAVTQEHLEAAVRDSRQSLSDQELQRLGRVYSAFQGAHEGIPPGEVGTRTRLA